MLSGIKKVLISCGATWVPIDPVRVISNTASGETGILLAKEFLRSGCKVTLLMGPANLPNLDRRIKVARFKYFDELKALLKKHLAFSGYDLVIHAAAVSDYRLKSVYGKKLDSDKKSLTLKLICAPKLISLFRHWDKNVKVVGFKFEPDQGRKHLISAGQSLLGRYGLSAVVANTAGSAGYEAYILLGKKICGPYHAKKEMAHALPRILRQGGLV